MLFLEALLIIGGIALLTASFLLGRRQDGASYAASPAMPGLSAPNAVKLYSQLTELIHELHTISRDVTFDLEEKLAQLKELLQVADTKLEGLTSADAPGFDTQPAAQSDFLDETPPVEWDPEADIGRQGSPAHLDRYRRIYELADQGLPIDEISRQVEMGKGEIQLILSLRDKD
ncbi:MAG: hypothetical protein Kow0099_28720 [Candidatus Abyssubacteria bacterium]